MRKASQYLEDKAGASTSSGPPRSSRCWSVLQAAGHWVISESNGANHSWILAKETQ